MCYKNGVLYIDLLYFTNVIEIMNIYNYQNTINTILYLKNLFMLLVHGFIKTNIFYSIIFSMYMKRII
jgi:hypothetical protein